MDRRILVGTGIGALAGSPMLAAAQESSPEIEDRFAALEARIAELESRIEALESSGENTAPTEDEPKDSSGEVITVSGIGVTVPDPVQLTAGRYRVNAEVTVTGSFAGFALFAYGPNGSQDLLFNELFDSGGVYELSALLNARDDGEYVFAVENSDASWTISIESL